MIIKNITPKTEVSIIPFVTEHVFLTMDPETSSGYETFGFTKEQVLNFLMETMLVYDSIDKETLKDLLIECVEKTDPWKRISEGYTNFYKEWFENRIDFPDVVDTIWEEIKSNTK